MLAFKLVKPSNVIHDDLINLVYKKKGFSKKVIIHFVTTKLPSLAVYLTSIGNLAL